MAFSKKNLIKGAKMLALVSALGILPMFSSQAVELGDVNAGVNPFHFGDSLETLSRQYGWKGEEGDDVKVTLTPSLPEYKYFYGVELKQYMLFFSFKHLCTIILTSKPIPYTEGKLQALQDAIHADIQKAYANPPTITQEKDGKDIKTVYHWENKPGSSTEVIYAPFFAGGDKYFIVSVTTIRL